MSIFKNVNKNSDIVQLIYLSKICDHQSEEEVERHIQDILDHSQINNLQHGITGGLLTDRKSFAQVIEGPAVSVAKLYSKIIRDKRHENITKLQHSITHIRLFHQWPLAFIEVDHVTGLDSLRVENTPENLRNARVSILQSFRPIFFPHDS